MHRHLLISLTLLSIALSAKAEDQSPTAAADSRVHDRLQHAVNVSRELAGQDVEPNTEALKEAALTMRTRGSFFSEETIDRFPLKRHVDAYFECRPWIIYDLWELDRYALSTSITQTLSLGQAQAIRKHLDHTDPAIRAMATECLSIMSQPEDVPKISAMLEDESVAAPRLQQNMSQSASMFVGRGFDPDVPDGEQLILMRSWQKQTVSQYARRALANMTGKMFENKAAFDTWWQVNHDAQNSLWYWQHRLARELRDATYDNHWHHVTMYPYETREQFHARRQTINQAAQDNVYQSIAKELRQLSPEVEAKVYLLAANHQLNGVMYGMFEINFDANPPKLRISTERLFELLDHKNWWAEVPKGDQGRQAYYLLTARIGLWANVLFTPEHIPRLRQLLNRPEDHPWQPNPIALTIGISRLLPPASPDQLDHPDTRDGILRQGIGKVYQPYDNTRIAITRELVRVGLPNNSDFLMELAFAINKDDTENEIAQGILQELAASPLTPQKRQFMIDLLLDPRFELFWTRANTRASMDMCRQYGIWAINAHAGTELIHDELKYDLTDPEKSDDALKKLYQFIEQLRQ